MAEGKNAYIKKAAFAYARQKMKTTVAMPSFFFLFSNLRYDGNNNNNNNGVEPKFKPSFVVEVVCCIDC